MTSDAARTQHYCGPRAWASRVNVQAWGARPNGYTNSDHSSRFRPIARDNDARRLALSVRDSPNPYHHPSQMEYVMQLVNAEEVRTGRELIGR